MEYVVDNGYGIFERSPESIAAQLSAWFSPSGRTELDAIAKRCSEVCLALWMTCFALSLWWSCHGWPSHALLLRHTNRRIEQITLCAGRGSSSSFALFRIVADLAAMAEAPRLRVPADNGRMCGQAA